MELPTETSVRKRHAAVSRREQLIRRHVLQQLRREVQELHASGLAAAGIGQELGISIRDVRAFLPKAKVTRPKSGLTERAITALIRGRYAKFGGETEAIRMHHLTRIATCYSSDELLAEIGVGIVTAHKIQFWLEAQGLKLRAE